MGCITSPVPEIDDLYFHQMPNGRPIKAEKAIRIGNSYIIVGQNGRYYSSNIGKFAYSPGRWPWLQNVMLGLQRLGILTASQVAEHLAACEESERKKKRRYAREDMKRLEKDFGVKFTKAQWKKVE